MPEKTLRAVTEWERYARTLPDANPVAFALSPDDSLGSDGYAIYSDDASTTVTSPTARGLLYGAYNVIDACKQAGGRFAALNTRETPHFDMRMLWSWSRLDNSYRHSPYMALCPVLSGAAIAAPEDNTEIMRFVRHMASMRVNALTITYELHTGELTSLDQHAYRPFYPQLRSFAHFLQEWGVGLYLFTSATPEKDFFHKSGETGCPFDPAVQNFWDGVIKELCEELPELEGLLVAGSLGGYAGGRLYQCDCAFCAGKTPIEKIRRQIESIAGMLGRYGKKLVYDLTTDNPEMLYREVDAALALADSLLDNVILSFKNHFQDFEELRYPEHPLLSRLPKMDNLPVAAEMQLFPEMRGKGLILSNTTEIWCDEIARLHLLGSKSIIGVIETHPDDAHPSMAEWYAWGRLAWDSHQRPRALLAQWTKMNYPPGVEAILPDLLLHSYMAASNTVYAGGLQCGAHGMLCPSPEFLKLAMNETWYRTDEPADFDVLGVDDEPLDLYTPELRREIAQNPRTFLLSKSYRLTPAVYDRLMREKDAAAAQYTALSAQWRTAEPLFAPGDYRYQALAGMLAKNTEDARRFRACLSLFWRYHMGCLTVREIDEARAELTGPHPPCSINTCDASAAAFLDRLRMKLLDIPYDARFNNMTDVPQITAPGWEARVVPPLFSAVRQKHGVVPGL